MAHSARVHSGVSLHSDAFINPSCRLIKLTFLILMMGSLLLINSSSFAGDEDVDTSIYPSPKPGYVKAVIRLKPKANEDLLKIELIIGRYLKVEACALNWYSGFLQEKEASGYFYHELINVKGPDSDPIACTEQRVKFVQVFLRPSNSGFMIYNSRLPIVVYVPEGFKVHYRIWKGYKKTGKAQVEY